MTKEEALAQIKALCPDVNIEADDIDSLVMCDRPELERVVEGWRLIAGIDTKTFYSKLGDVLGQVAEYAPIAAKVAAIAVAVL